MEQEMDKYEQLRTMCEERENQEATLSEFTESVAKQWSNRVARDIILSSSMKAGKILALTLGPAALGFYAGSNLEQTTTYQEERQYVPLTQEKAYFAKGTSMEDMLLIPEQPMYANQCLR